MDTIEREIVIAAPIERVWEIVTQPEHMGAGSATRAPSARANTIKMRWERARRGRAARRAQEQPPTTFAYRWDANDAGIGDTLVEFTLTPRATAPA